MVKIQLDEKYWLSSDEVCWNISYKRKNGKITTSFAHVGFYSSLGNAFEAYYELRMRDLPATTLKELEEGINSLKVEVTCLKDKLCLVEPSRKSGSGYK